MLFHYCGCLAPTWLAKSWLRRGELRKPACNHISALTHLISDAIYHLLSFPALNNDICVLSGEVFVEGSFPLKRHFVDSDDVTPSHTWKCIPPHCTVAMRVLNPMFLSSDARAHRSRLDLPICVSENIVKLKRPFSHCCLNWNKKPQWSNLLLLC